MYASKKPEASFYWQLGACPRIGILFKIKAFIKNKHSHIYDIGVYAYLRASFSMDNEEIRQNGILGQAHRA
jgi:hypothetical protein